MKNTLAATAMADVERLCAMCKVAQQVDDDLPFWIKRIEEALRRNAHSTTNAGSSHGSVSPAYVDALQDRLPEFFVEAVYDNLERSSGLVMVFW